MIGLGVSLLRGLTGLLGGGGSSGAAPAAGGLDRATFEELLSRARSGELSEGLGVSVARGVEGEVSEGTLAQLGPIVERAREQGASRIAVVQGDRVLEVDVLLRRVTAVKPLGSGELLGRVDAVARLEPEAVEPVVGPPSAARPVWAQSSRA